MSVTVSLSEKLAVTYGIPLTQHGSDDNCGFLEVVRWKVMNKIHRLNFSNFSRAPYELEDSPSTDPISVSGTKQNCKKKDSHWLMNIQYMLFSKFQPEVAHKFSWLGFSAVISDE